MKSPLTEADGSSLQTLLADSIQSRLAHDASDDLARAVTAGAVAGAFAGAVAGANAAAATVHARQLTMDASLDRGGGSRDSGGAALASPVTPASAQAQARSPPPSASPGGGEWARAFDSGTKAYYYYSTRTLETTWTTPPGWEAYAEGGELAKDLAQASLGERSTGGALPQRAEAAAASGSPPSLYARDTDIETDEEVDPRVGVALEEMNNAMCAVNDLEASITQAKRKVRQVEAEQKQKCQAAFDKLSRGVKEALPVCRKQILARQQLEKTRLAFVEYQRAHDAHAEAKAAAAAVESQLMASSGGSVVDTELLSQSSDLASRVVEAESLKLKADRVHAAEAKRLSELSLDVQNAPRVSKDHTERALQYMEFKARAEQTLLAEMDVVKSLEGQLKAAKQAYAASMRALDSISRDIHLKRLQRQQPPS